MRTDVVVRQMLANAQAAVDSARGRLDRASALGAPPGIVERFRLELDDALAMRDGLVWEVSAP